METPASTYHSNRNGNRKGSFFYFLHLDEPIENPLVDVYYLLSFQSIISSVDPPVSMYRTFLTAHTAIIYQLKPVTFVCKEMIP